ncbi:FapA family protein [Alicyclobacillus sp. SO9]|uniref:FapA family protein n=1 Tax=Alicyclobacillus sp. SO9 TaxID=2665646 RepID=UPI0018E84CF7|nr:FapA family protein [Alicyclobacillus sp. SO9]QQE79955.1 DUF342 domain-containing protein [Alicyclobacillus sp. SO9]
MLKGRFGRKSKEEKAGLKTTTSFHDEANVASQGVIDAARQRRTHLTVDGTVDGTVSILDGEVFVAAPHENGVKASLFIPEDPRISVTIDGTTMESGLYELSGSEQVTLTPIQIDPHCEIRLIPASGNMELIMSIDLQPGILYQPEDSPPENKLSLEWNEVEISAAPPTEADLLNILEQSEYKGEVDRSALSELALATDSVERVVLRGLEAYPSKPEEFREIPLPDPDYVDPLHRRMKLQAVQSGTAVGVVDAPVPPHTGTDIFGREVSPKPRPRQKPPELGPGVIRNDNTILAARAGRLVFTARIIDVVPTVEMNRLTAKDGQIVFDGDVKVYGDVEDGSLIKATGMIQVQGGVYGSVLVGENGILIGGHCVKTKVYAGWAKDMASQTLTVVKETVERLERYLKDVSRVLDDAREKLGNEASTQLQVLPSAVLDKYHVALPRHLSTLVEQYAKTSQHSLGKHLEPCIRLIQTDWIGPRLKELTLEKGIQLLNQLQAYEEYLEEHLHADAASVEINALTSSTVDATGPVSIVGRGTYASHIDSGKSIHVAGFARGGGLKAVDAISVRELGSPSGTETRASVTSRSGIIQVETRHPNTLLEVGGNVNRNLTQESHITFTDKRQD